MATKPETNDTKAPEATTTQPNPEPNLLPDTNPAPSTAPEPSVAPPEGPAPAEPALVPEPEPQKYVHPKADNRWPSYRDVALRFGCPGNGGDPNPEWESRNLLRMDLPYPMVTAWAEPDPHTKKWHPRLVRTVRVHRECSASLGRILNAIFHGLYEGDIEALQKAKMHLFTGLYSYKPSRREDMLSMHAFGAAIDFGVRKMPPEVVEIFEAEGWTWGGKDEPGHFEATQGK